MTPLTRTQLASMKALPESIKAENNAMNDCRNYPLSCQCTACLGDLLAARITRNTPPSPAVGAMDETTNSTGDTQ